MPNRKEHVGGKKHCPTCDSWLELDSYTKQSSSWDGLCRMCRECFREYKRNKRETDEKYKQKDQEYKEKYVESGRRREVSQKRYKEKRDEILENCKNYNKWRYHNDPVYKMGIILRSRARRELSKTKGEIGIDSYLELAGCTPEFLKNHIQSQFTEGMTWDNHCFSGWHVDHIKPLCSFDLNDNEEIKKAFHYSNLQPLWSEENLKKGGTTTT